MLLFSQVFLWGRAVTPQPQILQHYNLTQGKKDGYSICQQTNRKL
jgi:hypothetical protein